MNATSTVKQDFGIKRHGPMTPTAGPIDDHERPADDLVPVEPDDYKDLDIPARGICFVTAGDIVITTGSGNVRTLPSGLLAAGLLHSVRIRRVHETGTTAGDIWVAI